MSFTESNASLEDINEEAVEELTASGEFETELQETSGLYGKGSTDDYDEFTDKSEEAEYKIIENLWDAQSGKSFQDLFNTNLSKQLVTAKTIYQLSEFEVYIEICKQLKVVPITDYNEQRVLETFDANFRALGPKGTLGLSRALLMNSSINELKLRGNNIKSEGVSYLAELLQENYFIVTIDLSENQLGSDGAKAISELLQTSQYIESLNLSSNELRGDGAHLLIEGIKASKKLVYLNLSHNLMSDIGGEAFGGLLGSNPILKILDLSGNELYGTGATSLMKGLKSNTNLKVLRLAWNGFDDEIAQYINVALAINKTLCEFDLSYNCITEIGVRRMTKGLVENKTLKVLKLANNPLNADAALSLMIATHSYLNGLDLKGIAMNKKFVEMAHRYRRKRNFEFNVSFGSMIKIIKNTKIGGKETRNNSHPLEIIRKQLREKGCDLRDILIHAEGILDEAQLVPLFNGFQSVVAEALIQKLHSALKKERKMIDVNILISELDEAEGDIEIRE